MVTLPNLPRELRQETFKITFQHAVTEDIKLNHFLLQCIRNYQGWNLLRVLPFPHYLKLVLGPSPTKENESHPALFAPSIHNTVASLYTVFPDLVEDVNFVHTKSLDDFTNQMNQKLDSIREQGPDYNTAVIFHGQRAKARGELFDPEKNWYLRYQIESQSGGLSMSARTTMYAHLECVLRRMEGGSSE